ncbi:MAG TPA: hypothetical protein VKA21_16380, partial [Candidatus Binatia bacterium]|nr:hypothetical protein [Candidatus Binatia bacterium]
LVLWLVVPRGAAAAPDCAGATLLKLRVREGSVAFSATVTRPGLTHANFVTGPVNMLLHPPNSTAWGYGVTILPERFVTGATKTTYDHGGPFQGDVIIKNVAGQADTVKIVFRDPTADPFGTLGGDARLGININDTCYRSCVGPCAERGAGTRHHRLVCRRSDTYVPFADAGFGALARPTRRTQNAFCGLGVDTNPSCDFLVEERCLLPYPSSHFLKPDASTPTGLRLLYDSDAMPQNAGSTFIDPTDWATLDGYSPGPMIMTLFPDTGFPVDLTASNVAFHTNFARSLDADHPTVLMKADTGQRIVHFAELDANTTDVRERALIIRPGRRLEDATRYLVAFRNLVDTNGTPIRPRLAFRALRDAVPESVLAAACGVECAATIAGRQPVFTDIMQRLETNGVDPAELVLAWDFSTASTQTLTGWMTSIRDQAFALGTPTFTVDSVADGGGTGLNTEIWAEIAGTFQAPLFMTADMPASRLNLAGDTPTQNGYATVPYLVEIPRSVYNGGATTPGRPSLWGHGLLGNRTQVRGLNRFANEYGFVMAGVDMQGMSDQDVVPAIIPLIQDESKFHFIPERLHQGFLNHLLLGRLLIAPDGFSSHPAFSPGGSVVIDPAEVFYSGGSQGGIFGMAIMSIAEDFKRGFLAVPGANYSTLLHRSIDFDPFLTISRVAYPDRLDEELIIALIQQLWDRAEPQGYINHLFSGDLSTPPVPHKVLIHMSTCDSQVSNLATEIMARSIGVPQVDPPLRNFFDLPVMTAPYDGSAFVEIDWQKCGSRCNVPNGDNPGAACTTDADCPGAGDPPTRTRCDSGTPPLSNTAPPFENDAHGAEGNAPPTAPGAQQTDAFLRTNGTVQQFCAGTCDPS